MVLRHANQVVLIVGYVCGFASTSLPAFGMFDETDIAMALMKIQQVYEIWRSRRRAFGAFATLSVLSKLRNMVEASVESVHSNARSG